MNRRLALFFLLPLTFVGCASDPNVTGPEGTGDHKIGYELGRSDAVKEQYWIVQNLQRQPKTPAPKAAQYPVLIPGQTINGVTTVPHTETIRIEQ